MARRLMAAGNWKLNMNRAPARELAGGLAAKLEGGKHSGVDVVVAPVFTAISAVVEAIEGSAIEPAAQNVYWEDGGAFTGEISAPMLADAGCKRCIIGHSERRQYFGETEETVNKRLHALLKAGVDPIVCIGETLEQRKRGQTKALVTYQLLGALDGVSDADAATLVVAYEPVWAIGTGETATPQQAQDVHATLRAVLTERFNAEIAGGIRILYGGSVKPGNAAELFSCEDIDGGLVGGASLKVDDFYAIIEAAAGIGS